MTQIPLFSSGSFLLGVLFLSCLTGCKEDIALLDAGGQVVGKGALEITATFPSPAHLMLDGKEYTGYWNRDRIYEEPLARSRRLISEHAYTAYEVGNDPAQLKHGQTSLTASDGSEVRCDFYYRSQPVAGHCDAAGKQLKLIVHQYG